MGRNNNKKIGFLVQMRTRKFAFEMYWPLTGLSNYSCIIWVLSMKFELNIWEFPNFTSYGDFKYCTWLVGTRRRSDDETFSHLDDRYLVCGTRDVSTQETCIKVRQIMKLSAYLWIMYPNFALPLTILGRWLKHTRMTVL